MRSLFSLFMCALLLPSLALAADIRVITSTPAVGVGDTFEVSVVVASAAEPVNAIEGALRFSPNLELVRIEDANSIVLFWAERPAHSESGVSFSGIMPGGYQQSDGTLLRLVFHAVGAGGATVYPEGVRVLKHDGAATPVDVTLSPLSFTVQAAPTGASVAVAQDAEPPESFVVTRAQDPAMFDNDWFLVFATQDKASGIDRYEVCEGRRCVAAESPYRLRDQRRTGIITVKAFDRAGNERESVVSGGSAGRLVSPFAMLGAFLFVVVVFAAFGRKIPTLWHTR